jgi:hypothetical protein
MPDVSGVFFSCYIHASCVRVILQLLYPCLICESYSSADVSMSYFSGVFLSGYSSCRITLTQQAWIQQLKNNPDKSDMDTAAEE